MGASFVHWAEGGEGGDRDANLHTPDPCPLETEAHSLSVMMTVG